MVKKTQQPINQNKYVIDGGSLLHRVSWKSNTSYRDVISQYQSFQVDVQKTYYSTKTTILSNGKNKMQFINMLSTCDGYDVIQCGDDADTSIVFALLGDKVTVVADDTDIFILLSYLSHSEMEEIVL